MKKKKEEKKELAEMQKRFCFELARCGNAETAAQRAGYKHPSEKAGELMMKDEILDEVLRFSKKLKEVSIETAYAGFERLAFESIEDAVRLIFLNDVRDDDIRGMNLLGVSEIKRTKDKGLEIKFFDRIKALEKLSALREDSPSSVGGLLDALKSAADAGDESLGV